MSHSILRANMFFILGTLLLTRSLAAAVESTPSDGDHSINDWTVEQVVASLKEGREASVSFEEATYSSLLTEPLIVRGVLRFTTSGDAGKRSGGTVPGTLRH